MTRTASVTEDDVKMLERLAKAVWILVVGAFGLGCWVTGIQIGQLSANVRLNALETAKQDSERRGKKIEFLLIRIADKLNIDTRGIEE